MSRHGLFSSTESIHFQHLFYFQRPKFHRAIIPFQNRNPQKPHHRHASLKSDLRRCPYLSILFKKLLLLCKSFPNSKPRTRKIFSRNRVYPPEVAVTTANRSDATGHNDGISERIANGFGFIVISVLLRQHIFLISLKYKSVPFLQR